MLVTTEFLFRKIGCFALNLPSQPNKGREGKRRNLLFLCGCGCYILVSVSVTENPHVHSFSGNMCRPGKDTPRVLQATAIACIWTQHPQAREKRLTTRVSLKGYKLKMLTVRSMNVPNERSLPFLLVIKKNFNLKIKLNIKI